VASSLPRSRAAATPHVTAAVKPDLQLVDVERVVASCSSLQVLHLATLQDSFASALVQLSDLTRLHLVESGDEQCGALAQLTGLKELTVQEPSGVSAAGLRQLAALEQLTSLGFGCSFDPSKVSHLLQQTCQTHTHCVHTPMSTRCGFQPWVSKQQETVAALCDASTLSDRHAGPLVCAHAYHDICPWQSFTRHQPCGAAKACWCHCGIWAEGHIRTVAFGIAPFEGEAPLQLTVLCVLSGCVLSPVLLCSHVPYQHGWAPAIVNALPALPMLQAPAGHPSAVPARLLRVCDLAAAGDS